MSSARDPNAASVEMAEKFWSDWFDLVGRMQAEAAASMRPSDRKPEAAEVEDGGAFKGMPGAEAFMTPDAMRQFQKAFLDALSAYCEEYMRSPQFLAVMKQALDNALTFRQQVNEFLGGAVAAGFQPPAGMPADQAVIVDAIRETERKLRDQIDGLADRIGRIEARVDGRAEA